MNKDKKFIGYRGLYIHRNKKWRWQIRFKGKIKTFTIGDVKNLKEEDVKKIIDAINLKENNTEEEIKYKIQEQKISLKKNSKNNEYFLKDDLEKIKQENDLTKIDNTQLGLEVIKPCKIFNISTSNEELIYCKNILPIKKGVCSILSGKGGAGKSFLIIQEALQFLYENTAAKAFLWLTEDSEIEIKNRIIMTLFFILKIKKPKEVASILNRLFFYGSSTSPILFFDENNNRIISKRFLNMISSLDEYDFIALDPFSSFFNGDENSNVEVNLFIKKITKYVSVNDKIFFILHHHSKNGQLRGATAFRDGVRLHYSVIKRNGNNVMVEIEKDNINIQKHFDKKNKKTITIFEEVDNKELNKYHTLIKELELMFNSDVDKLEESKIIKTIKSIQEEVKNQENKNLKHRTQEYKDLSGTEENVFEKRKEKSISKNPFNLQIEKQILNIMN